MVIGIIMILLAFKDGFNIELFLPGAILTVLGIVLLKRKKRPIAHTSIVYVTRNGGKYHSNEGCPALRSAHMIGEMAIEDAVNSGLTACEKCM
jgi:hypothetical protein